MNTFSLEHYRKIVQTALEGTGAFVRISRSDGLFVTDARRRNADMEEIVSKLPGFFFYEKDGLIFLTPDYGFSDETNRLLTEILKADKEKSEKLIRTNLALAMRLKNEEQLLVFQILYERMIGQ